MKLYEFRKARSYKCIWLLNELGVSFERESVNLMQGEQLSEKFLKINPFGKVPALDDNEFVLFEATAICNYLADKYPEPKLIPEPRSKQRAVYDQWTFFMANELECHLWSIEKNTWGYAEDKRSFQEIENAKNNFLKAIKIIDNELEENTYLLGKYFSVADISLGYLLRWAKSHELLNSTKNLKPYYEELIKREKYPHDIFKKSSRD